MSRTAEQRIRDGIVALADWLTDRDDYDIPEPVLDALCPNDVPDDAVLGGFEDLLRVVVARTDRTVLPAKGQDALDEMTGVR